MPVSTAVSYHVDDWLEQYETLRSGCLKQFAYSAMWPLFNIEAKRWLTSATLQAYKPSAVFRERGFPIEARRRWALARLDVRNAVILVQGTGSGWDVLTWARFRPKRVIATDLFVFDGWDEISRYCASRWNVECEFRQAPARGPFISDVRERRHLCVRYGLRTLPRSGRGAYRESSGAQGRWTTLRRLRTALVLWQRRSLLRKRRTAQPLQSSCPVTGRIQDVS